MTLQPDVLHAMTQAMEQLPTPLPAGAISSMAHHWQMVRMWNANINVTAIDDPRQAASLHYRDALMALPYLQPGITLDVGSGGGFPGIPLAIAKPDQPFLLMEPRRKRATLLQQAAAKLQLRNVNVYNGRLSDAPQASCAQVVTRATFSSLNDFAPAAAWLRPQGRLMAFRSQASSLPQEELKALEAHGLHYELGHAYTLLHHALRLDVWILRGDVGDNRGTSARG